MSKTLAHGIQIKKASFKVDATLKSLSNFKGQILKSSSLNDYSILKDKNVALIGFNSNLLNALDKALPYARFIKLFCENPSWVLKYDQPIFAWHSPIASERINRLRHEGQQKGYFKVSAQNNDVQLAINKTKQNLKKIQNQWLARQLTPNHLLAEHKFIFNDHFYQNVQNPRVKVMTWPVVQIQSNGILTMEGIHHLVDAIITAD